MLRTTNHPNIIKYADYCENGVVKFIRSGRVTIGYMCIIYNDNNSESLYDKFVNTILTL
jgi:hypothetical protein